ncbi:MAG TPA: hypothetical protein VFD63_19415 [Pyrinomonadaceae bacterium]|nr:hypothetical protein [Pyrinomonadaceae bacterium]
MFAASLQITRRLASSVDLKFLGIIDTGIDPTHPHLLGLVDGNRSASFCADEDPVVQQQFPGYPAWTKTQCGSAGKVGL